MIGMSGQGLQNQRPPGDFGRGTSLHTAPIYPLAGSLKTFPKQSSPELSIADSPNCLNVEVYRGELRSVLGMSNVLAQVPGSPSLITSLYGGDGIRRVLAATDIKVYRWDAALWTWVDITGAASLTGVITQPPMSTNSWGKWYFSNGVNYIYYWHESLAAIARLENADPTKNPPDACYFIYPFGDRLNCVSTKEAGIWYRKRLRWSDFLDGTNFVDGSAGYKDMEESSYFPTGVSVFPDRALIFRPDGLTIQRRNLSTFYQFNTVRGPGCIAPRSIVQIPQENICIYLGKQGVYTTNGTSFQKVSQDLFWENLLTDLQVSPNRLYLAEGFLTSDEYRYVLLFWAGGGPWLIAGVVWNFKENTWTKLLFPSVEAQENKFTTTGVYGQIATATTWAAASIPWSSAGFTWEETVGEVINDTVVLGRADGTIQKWEGDTNPISPLAEYLSWYSSPKPLPSRDAAIDHNEEQKIVFYGSGRFFARIGIGDDAEHITYADDWQDINLTLWDGRFEMPVRKKGRFHQVQIKGSVAIDSMNIIRIEPKYMLAGEM